MTPTEAQIQECLIHWPGWISLHTRLLTTDPRTSDPHDLAGPIQHYGIFRAACLLHAEGIGQTLADSAQIAGHLLAMAQNGKRPRYGKEMGLTAAHFAERAR